MCAARGTLPGQNERERERVHMEAWRAAEADAQAAKEAQERASWERARERDARRDAKHANSWQARLSGRTNETMPTPPPPPPPPPSPSPPPPPPPPPTPRVSRKMRFAKAPSTLRPHDGPHPIGSCEGYAPLGCTEGFASSDIFFLETCFYSMICANRDELWKVAEGEDWECELDREGFERVKAMVLRPGSVPARKASW
jgi:hypothetical protein